MYNTNYGLNGQKKFRRIWILKLKLKAHAQAMYNTNYGLNGQKIIDLVSEALTKRRRQQFQQERSCTVISHVKRKQPAS
jgi:hypothetical protein